MPTLEIKTSLWVPPVFAIPVALAMVNVLGIFASYSKPLQFAGYAAVGAVVGLAAWALSLKKTVVSVEEGANNIRLTLNGRACSFAPRSLRGRRLSVS